jgi:hypothetical protein
MKVYVFGNQNLEFDNNAIDVAKNIGTSFPEVEFVTVKLNQDLPFDNKQDVVLMDVVEGLTDVQLLEDDELAKIVLPPRTTAHDFDLGFQLKYLKKLGKLGQIKIIGLPMLGKIDYALIHSILRKLVAQDIQGS